MSLPDAVSPERTAALIGSPSADRSPAPLGSPRARVVAAARRVARAALREELGALASLDARLAGCERAVEDLRATEASTALAARRLAAVQAELQALRETVTRLGG